MKLTFLTATCFLVPLSLHAATLTSGHVDLIGIGYDLGDLFPHGHVEGGTVDGNFLLDDEFLPGDLTVQVSATVGRETGTAWNPVGVGSGVSFWRMAEENIPGEPYAGIGAEELDPSEWTSPITIALTGIVGPTGAVFSFWQTDGFGVPTFYMSTLDGIDGADVFSMDLGVSNHQHFGWGFTALGDYQLTYEISGTHAVDGFKTASATYNISVVPEPSSALLAGLGGLALLRRRRN